MNKVLKFFLILLLSIIIVIVSAFVTINIMLNKKLDKINYVTLPKEDVYINEQVSEDNTLSEYRNIALLGIDARSDTFDVGNRSDCIMIVSINMIL